ncbi:MAG: MFS transporter [Candidatus Kapabacteria bacterium]|nr:MFS transporter [Candidatus Kapabacteria bacterium]
MQHRHWLYLIAWVCTASSGIAATLFSVYLPSIAKDFAGSVPVKEFIPAFGSACGGSFLIGWAVGAFVLGALADRIGRRMALFLCVALSTVGMSVTGLISDFSILVAVRFATGFGAGSVLALSTVLVSEVFHTGRRAVLVGILINAFPVGFIVAGMVASSQADWRVAFSLTTFTLVLPLLILLVVRESDMWQARANHHRTSSLAHLFAAAHRKDLLVGVALFGSMLVGLWAVFAWMPTWVHHMSDAAAAQQNRALTNIMLGGGSVAGGLVSGLLSERFGRRMASALAYLGCIGMTLLIFQSGQQIGAWLFICTFLLSTFIGINQGVLSTYIPELFPTRLRGSATGVSMNAGRFITAITVFFVGVLVPLLGGYENAISIFAVAYVVGLIVLMWARETHGAPLPD